MDQENFSPSSQTPELWALNESDGKKTQNRQMHSSLVEFTAMMHNTGQ